VALRLSYALFENAHHCLRQGNELVRSPLGPQFIEIHLRLAGYDGSFIDITREVVTLLVTERMSLVAWILQILDSL